MQTSRRKTFASLWVSFVLFSGGIGLLIFPKNASAHAHLIKASPAKGSTVSADAAPSRISLEFSEGVESALSKVEVHQGSASGPDVTEGKPSSPEGKKSTLEIGLKHPLAAGPYYVQWKIVSVDTHKMKGEFQFTVK